LDVRPPEKGMGKKKKVASLDKSGAKKTSKKNERRPKKKKAKGSAERKRKFT